MIPILESLSSNVSKLPMAASVAQSFSNAGGSGGFAATLAVAQAQSTSAQSGNAGGEGLGLTGSTGSSAEEAAEPALGVTSNLNGRGVVWGTSQLRKPIVNSLSNGSVALALAGVVVANSPLLEPIPAAPPAVVPTQLGVSQPNLPQSTEPLTGFSPMSAQPSGPGQSGLSQSRQQPSSELQSGLAQPNSLATAAAVAVPAQISGITAGSAQPTLPAIDFNAATPAAAGPNAVHSSTTLDSSILSPAISLPSPASESFTAPLVTSDSNGATATADHVPANQSSSASRNSPQSSWGTAELAVLAENTLPVVSSAFGQSATSTLSANATEESQGIANVSGLATAADSTQNQTVSTATPASNLLANAFAEAVPQAGLPSSGVGQPGESNSSSDGAQGTVASTSSAVSAETGLPVSEGTAAPISNLPSPSVPVSGQQIPNAALLNLAAQMLSRKVAVPVAAAPLTNPANSTGVRVASARTNAPVSNVPSEVAVGSNSGTASPIANQTPFSVFFSNAGPGTESAASALPKIVTPVTASASHLTNSVAGGTQAANSPQVGSQNGGSQNTSPQNPSLRDALSGTNSGGSQTAQTLRREADSSVTGVAVASSQATATNIPVPPAPSGITVSPVALAADSVAKPESLPAPAPPESPAVPAPPPPPTPPTAIPGPVQVAQMVNRIGQSEMRIGMNTSAFGTVDVRTVVHASDVGLVIGSEKGDLRGLMANEMPGISNILQQQNLRLNSVSFMQGFASPGNGNGSGGGSYQQPSFIAQRASSNSPIADSADDSVDTASVSDYGSSRGLSILA